MEIKEIFRSIKIAKAPTKTFTTMQAQFTTSMILFNKLKRLKIRTDKNHYAMKNQIWLVAQKNLERTP